MRVERLVPYRDLTDPPLTGYKVIPCSTVSTDLVAHLFRRV